MSRGLSDDFMRSQVGMIYLAALELDRGDGQAYTDDQALALAFESVPNKAVRKAAGLPATIGAFARDILGHTSASNIRKWRNNCINWKRHRQEFKEDVWEEKLAEHDDDVIDKLAENAKLVGDGATDRRTWAQMRGWIGNAGRSGSKVSVKTDDGGTTVTVENHDPYAGILARIQDDLEGE